MRATSSSSPQDASTPSAAAASWPKSSRPATSPTASTTTTAATRTDSRASSTPSADYRTHYEPLPNQSVEVVSCPYFRTAVITVKGTAALDYTTIDSFVVLIAVKGSGTLTIDGDRIPLQAGHTLLLPATTSSIEMSGTLTVLETHV